MAEVISEQQPRVKFQTERLGEPTHTLSLETPDLQASEAFNTLNTSYWKCENAAYEM